MIEQPKLLPEVKVRWLAALRSGQYQQGKGRLRSEDNEYCCLGVLCDLLEPEAWTLVQSEHRYAHRDGSVAFPPFEVTYKVLVGSTPPASWRTAAAAFWRLARLNDDGQTFDAIATEIEKKL